MGAILPVGMMAVTVPADRGAIKKRHASDEDMAYEERNQLMPSGHVPKRIRFGICECTIPNFDTGNNLDDFIARMPIPIGT